MKVRIQTDGQSDEPIPNHGDQVHAQEKHKEELLLFSLVGESQEEEFRDGGLVSFMRISADVKKGMQGRHAPTRTPSLVLFSWVALQHSTIAGE